MEGLQETLSFIRLVAVAASRFGAGAKMPCPTNNSVIGNNCPWEREGLRVGCLLVDWDMGIGAGDSRPAPGARRDDFESSGSVPDYWPDPFPAPTQPWHHLCQPHCIPTHDGHCGPARISRSQGGVLVIFPVPRVGMRVPSHLSDLNPRSRPRGCPGAKIRRP